MRTHKLATVFVFAVLSACGGSPGEQVPPEPTTTGGGTGTMPITRAAADPNCQDRAGEIYDVVIPSPVGADINATVFEPTTFQCSERYPLILYASGFGGFRQTSLEPAADPQSVAFTAIITPQAILAAGYGLMTFDHTGHNGAPGVIRVMDPDYEGQNLIATVDWAEENLPWLAYGDSADGSDPDNLKLGAVGASYGGGFQNLLLAIDPRQRIDAIVPQVTWNYLPDSLAPGGVIKDGWVNGLAGGVTTFDPFLEEQLALIFEENRVNPEIVDFLGYHGLDYFCSGEIIPTNGGAGTSPFYAPTAPPLVNALVVQSSRDILFDLNEGYDNYRCLRQGGGDVHLFTMQAGHNTLGITGTLGATDLPDDPGVAFQPFGAATASDTICNGNQVATTAIAFFDKHLKDMPANADALLDPDNPVCLSLTQGDYLLVEDLMVGGTEFTINGNNVVTVGQDDSANSTTVLLGQVPTTEINGAVLAGIPQLTVTVTDEDDPNNTDPNDNTIIFAAIGHRRSALSGSLGTGTWDIVDNQIEPLRGLGSFNIDLVGVMERIGPGDELGLMLFGANENQFETTSSKAEFPFAARVRVEGTVRLPLLDGATLEN